jgi:pimeloyl-ACP methyl ester carboxylesterase
MTTFILVPGAWLGAWAWKRVVPLLEERGHVAYPITLSGVAERAHLASQEVGMDTGIQDVLGVIRYNDLDDFVLVGHSNSGKVVAAVADRTTEKIHEVLYLDGFSPKKVQTPQGSFPDEFPVEGSIVPFPVKFLDVVGKDVKGADREWLLSKASPMPVRYFRDPITLSAKYDSVKTAYIFCTGGDLLPWYRSQSPSGDVEAVLKAKLDGPYKFLGAGHWPMITKPEELAEAMIALAE